MEAQPRQIQRYITSDGKNPFAEWLDSLRNNKIKSIIDKRLNRVSEGNLGDYRFIEEGVCELRINYGSGYRIYIWTNWNDNSASFMWWR